MKKIIFTITTILMILVFGGYASANEIKVENPDVKVTTSGDRFSPVNVEYKTKFSDDLKINNGDKVIFNLPQELNLQTSYNFDVKGTEGNVVGKATASVENNNVTTVFNDYFTKRPLNKSMQLSLMTVWNKEKVTGTETTTYDLNFNGTIVTTKVDKDGVPDPQEIVTKWGAQNGDTINWAGRVNYKKANLTNVTITDKWDSNQEYIPGSLKARILSSIDPWTKIGEVAKENIDFNANGFTIKLPALNEIISLEYSTKVKDLTKNPTNNLRVQADNNVDWDKDVEVQIAKGDGSVEGENKPEPTFDIPNDAPVVDKPELNLNDVPLLPPAPVVEIPELPLEDIPMMPPALVVDIPELEILETPNKVEQPKITKVTKKTKVEEKVKKLANTGLKNDDLTLLVVLMMAAVLVIKREKGRRYER